MNAKFLAALRAVLFHIAVLTLSLSLLPFTALGAEAGQGGGSPAGR